MLISDSNYNDQNEISELVAQKFGCQNEILELTSQNKDKSLFYTEDSPKLSKNSANRKKYGHNQPEKIKGLSFQLPIRGINKAKNVNSDALNRKPKGNIIKNNNFQ